MNTITFKGEGEHWEAEVSIHQRSEIQTEDVTIKYKEDYLNVGKFEYMVTANR